MPTAPLAACLEPYCPGRAIDRGYCSRHQRSEEQRGYGAVHRAQRAARKGDPCELCGALGAVLDHRVPASLDGTDRLSNKRWLCATCHHRFGLRKDSPLAGHAESVATTHPRDTGPQYQRPNHNEIPKGWA